MDQQSRLDQLLQLLQLYFKLLLLFLFISLAIGDAPSFASTYGATLSLLNLLSQHLHNLLLTLHILTQHLDMLNRLLKALMLDQDGSYSG